MFILIVTICFLLPTIYCPPTCSKQFEDHQQAFLCLLCKAEEWNKHVGIWSIRSITSVHNLQLNSSELWLMSVSQMLGFISPDGASWILCERLVGMVKVGGREEMTPGALHFTVTATWRQRNEGSLPPTFSASLVRCLIQPSRQAEPICSIALYPSH